MLGRADRDWTWSTPSSPAYRQALAGIWPKASVLTTERLQRLFEPFEVARALYAKLEPRRRSNDAGEAFAIEMHYVGGDLPANALAFHNGRCYCVAFTGQLYALLERIAQHVVSDTLIQRILYADMASVRALCPALIRRSAGACAVTPLGFAIGDELSASPNETAADINDTESDAALLRDLALEYVLHHEVGHIVCGHVGLLKAQVDAMGVAEASDTDAPFTTEVRRNMEHDADMFAARMFFLTAPRRHRDRASLCQINLLQLIAIYIVQSAFAVLDLMVNKGIREEELFVKGFASEEGRYPAAGIRITAAYLSFIQSMYVAGRKRLQGYEPECDVEAAFRLSCVISRLNQQHAEFAIIGRSLARDIDGLFARSEALDAEASLRASCRRFAFL